MNYENHILLGQGESPSHLALGLANRHGLIAGATGTGKTVSLQVLAEGFSRHGIPVFLADVKGDLSGISQAGTPSPRLLERASQVGIGPLTFRGFPTCFWDLFGEQGHPIRATISDMGPLLLAQLLELNDTQEGVLNLTFKLADDEGLLLLDVKDLRAMLSFVAENTGPLSASYGHVSKASVGAILRRLLALEQEGGDRFFGEPAMALADLILRDSSGLGYINILSADRLIRRPRSYATFLLWMLAELFEELPEIGDPPKPKLVFFFDEAHLLFDRAPKALLDKIEQVVRLIRSKGVGIYFVTQSPGDIPDTVLGQLGNRVQHALRAFTPREQRAVRVAAETFRPNPRLDTARAIQELGVGEALVSTLEDKGIPSIVERVLIRPPASRIGPASREERQALIRGSALSGRYDHGFDRESAYEILNARSQTAALQAEEERSYRGRIPSVERRKSRTSNRQSIFEAMAKSVVRSVGSSIGRQIARGILGSLFKGR